MILYKPAIKRKFFYIALLIVFPVPGQHNTIPPFEKIKKSAIAEQNSAGCVTADESAPIEYPLLYRGIFLIHSSFIHFITFFSVP
jgi:hypothetical protein